MLTMRSHPSRKIAWPRPNWRFNQAVASLAAAFAALHDVRFGPFECRRFHRAEYGAARAELFDQTLEHEHAMAATDDEGMTGIGDDAQSMMRVM